MLLTFNIKGCDHPKFEWLFIAGIDKLAFLLYAAANAQLFLWGCHLEQLYH